MCRKRDECEENIEHVQKQSMYVIVQYGAIEISARVHTHESEPRACAENICDYDEDNTELVLKQKALARTRTRYYRTMRGVTSYTCIYLCLQTPTVTRAAMQTHYSALYIVLGDKGDYADRQPCNMTLHENSC